jgi:hypothetical protein
VAADQDTELWRQRGERCPLVEHLWPPSALFADRKVNKAAFLSPCLAQTAVGWGESQSFGAAKLMGCSVVLGPRSEAAFHTGSWETLWTPVMSRGRQLPRTSLVSKT